jgi:hypothetical protein
VRSSPQGSGLATERSSGSPGATDWAGIFIGALIRACQRSAERSTGARATAHTLPLNELTHPQ